MQEHFISLDEKSTLLFFPLSDFSSKRFQFEMFQFINGFGLKHFHFVHFEIY